MFAVLAHHLGAPFVPLNVDLALGAALDGGLVLLQSERGAAGKSQSAPAQPARAGPSAPARLRESRHYRATATGG